MGSDGDFLDRLIRFYGTDRASETETYAVAALTETVSSATALPELSPPSGNGVAYEKFLAIYEELLSGNSTLNLLA